MKKKLLVAPCKDICIHRQTSSGSGDLSGGGMEEINFVIFFLCHHNHGTKMFFLHSIEKFEKNLSFSLTSLNYVLCLNCDTKS